MNVLTARRRAILAVVNAYAWESRGCPSWVEIGDAVGLSSVATVDYHLGVLRDAELITSEPRINCTLRLGPLAAGSRNGVIAQVVASECRSCHRLAPIDHECRPEPRAVSVIARAASGGGAC